MKNEQKSCLGLLILFSLFFGTALAQSPGSTMGEREGSIQNFANDGSISDSPYTEQEAVEGDDTSESYAQGYYPFGETPSGCTKYITDAYDPKAPESENVYYKDSEGNYSKSREDCE